jgi:hypothetical protein
MDAEVSEMSARDNTERRTNGAVAGLDDDSRVVGIGGSSEAGGEIGDRVDASETVETHYLTDKAGDTLIKSSGLKSEI